MAKFYWTATPKSVLRRGFEAIEGQVDLPFGVADVDDLPFGVDDELVTTVVDATGFGEAKLAALRRAPHPDHRRRRCSSRCRNMLGREVLAVEHFRLVRRRARRRARRLTAGRQDLFAGC